MDGLRLECSFNDTSQQIPDKVISTTNAIFVRLERVRVDGVERHLAVILLSRTESVDET